MSGTEFKNNVEMRNFAYAKAIGLGESTVKEAVGAYLRERGYEVFIGQQGERGADIRATKNGLPLIIEAKGEGSRDPMYNNFFLHALGEIIQRMRENAAEYGIALPAHRKYVRLVDELSPTPRFTIRLNFYFVRPTADAGYEVGMLGWQLR